MRILIDIGTPPQVHLFKNIIWNLEGEGREVKITARDSQITLYLLDTYGFKYEKVREGTPQIYRKILNIPKADYRIYKIAKSFEPDILVSFGSLYLAHVAKLIKKPHIAFEDTEGSREQYWLYAPFTDAICTPTCFKAKINPKKHVRFNGYKELAYLHPNWFKPDSSVLDDLDLAKDDKFTIVRFSSWDASHDIGQKGFKSWEERINFIKTLEKYGKIFVTSEIPLPKSLERNRLTIPPEKIHDLLFYATMYIGGGATLASEAGVLGVPWIWISAGEMRGYLEDQGKNYGLGYCAKTPQQALERAIELLENPDLKQEWQKKRKKLLKDKIDVTAFMIWFIENYPESFQIMKDSPEYQERFK